MLLINTTHGNSWIKGRLLNVPGCTIDACKVLIYVVVGVPSLDSTSVVPKKQVVLSHWRYATLESEMGFIYSKSGGDP
jgi:hypothetical protein